VIVKYLLKIAMLGSSWVMYLLLALSVASVGAMVERWWFFRKRGEDGDELGDALCHYLEHGERDAAYNLLEQSPTIEAEVLRASLRWAHGGPQALAAAIEGEMTKRRRELERGMTLLGTLGNNAPFVGLLGTVIGVIVAFADLADGQNKIQMDKVMGGIAEALVATGVGLFVAIPAVVAYNVFQKKIGNIEDNVASISQRLCAFITVGRASDWLRPSTAPPAIKLAAEGVRDLATRETESSAQRAAPAREAGGGGIDMAEQRHEAATAAGED
jgi:biopolymer transport protein ExbB/biopolymer transport protein TolQ